MLQHRLAAAAWALLLLPGPAAGATAAAPPPVYPVPQSETVLGGTLGVPRVVRLVVGPATDSQTVDVVREVLQSAGAQRFTTTPTRGALVVAVGLRATDVPPQGYVLRIARGLVELAGADADGTFYAAQTLHQLVRGRFLPAVAIRDWPSLPERGVVEGFYGPPWSFAARLAALDFLAAHKLNRFIYSPKDDGWLRGLWRDPYPPAQLDELRALLARAAADHVTFTYALSPGASICYSSDADFAALVAKLQSVWDVGVRSFEIALDDVKYDAPNCDADQARFGSGPGAAGAAQAYLVNRVVREFISTHPGAARLIVVPTEYDTLSQSPYKASFGGSLDPSVIVQWTGVTTYSPAITRDDAAAARKLYQHDVLVWDNYPVVPRAFPRALRLGPYQGREPGLGASLLGITANPMVPPELSRIALFTVADFAWNDAAYDPARSWAASLAEAAGGDPDAIAALRAFADVNYASPVDPRQAPDLSEPINAFWGAWWAGSSSEDAALRDALVAVRDAPAVLRARLQDQELLAEATPWLDAATTWAQADLAALDMLVAAREGRPDEAAADRQAALTLVDQVKRATFVENGEPEPLTVGAGALDTFVENALAAVP